MGQAAIDSSLRYVAQLLIQSALRYRFGPVALLLLLHSAPPLASFVKLCKAWLRPLAGFRYLGVGAALGMGCCAAAPKPEKGLRPKQRLRTAVGASDDETAPTSSPTVLKTIFSRSVDFLFLLLFEVFPPLFCCRGCASSACAYS